jgi:CRISPR/Cas system-associated exonuclease Cas4 (RecB family)
MRRKTAIHDPQSEVRLIRASEIGEYEYCSRAWWYKHVAKVAPGGDASGRLELGRQAHRRHGQAVAMSARLRAIGVGLLLCGALALALALLTK